MTPATLQAPCGPRPWLAALLSVLLPGLGHVHALHYRRGLIAFLVMLGLDLLGSHYTYQIFTGLALTLVASCLWVALVAVDAHRCARMQQGQPTPWFTRWTSLLPVALLAFFLPAPTHFGAGLPGARYRFFSQTSASMVPTLSPGDHLVADMRCYRTHAPKRLDLVVFEAPKQVQVPWVMRCVAVPGDLVEVRDGIFYLNGTAQGQASAQIKGPGPAPAPQAFGPLQLPEGTIFCLGDNRSNSYDSRFWGPLRLEAVQGKALYSFQLEPGWTLAKVTSKRLS